MALPSLLLPEEKWPKGISARKLRKQTVDEPLAQDMTVTWIGAAKDTKNEYFSPAKYSSLARFLRVTAYLTRFIYNCRHSKSEGRIGTLLVEEIEHAQKFWIRTTQAESFPQEVAALKSKRHVSSKSKLVLLSPFLDEHGIVRAGGRIERADILFCSRHPIELSPDNEFTCLIVNELRQQYWILRCCATVQKILHRCSYCRRRKAKPVPPMMASLPYDRLQIAPAFSKVGVDFCGPLKVKHLRNQEKRYSCLFTCVVDRVAQSAE